MAVIYPLNQKFVGLLTIFVGAVCLLTGVSASRCAAATTEQAAEATPRPPALDLAEIWFYKRDMQKQIPAVDLTWITVAFFSAADIFDSGQDKRAAAGGLQQSVQALVDGYDEIIDSFHDGNLAEKAYFLRLQEGLNLPAVQNLINRLNQNAAIRYVHPTLEIDGRTYVFLDSFLLDWKTGVDPETKRRLMNQAHVTRNGAEDLYRVDLSENAYFRAVNLLAEDIHVRWCEPHLIELKPLIQAELVLPISGGNAGDRIPFSLEITFSEAVQIEPSCLANINLRPSGIQKELFDLTFDFYDYTQAAVASPIRITGQMACYAPGEYLIPPVAVTYTCTHCADGNPRSIETRPLSFKVSSIVPSRPVENKLIIPMDTVDPEDKTDTFRTLAGKNRLAALVFFLISLACAAGFIAAKAAAGKRDKIPLAQNTAQNLAQELAALLKTAPSGPHWIYMAAANKIFRRYIVARYHIVEFAAHGSGEVFFESIRLHLPENRCGRIQRFFKCIDQAAALELDTYPQIDSFRNEGLQLLA